MITITAHGRLAAQPELKRFPNFVVCEFRLLSTRFAQNTEHTEAVTFFCYGEDAEEICSTTVKGQEMSVTGTQETQRYTKGNEDKTFVKYRMTWFTRGRKPYVGDRNQSQPRDNGGNQGYGRNDAPQQVAPRGGYPSRSSEPQGNGDGRYSNSGYGRIDAPPQGAPRGGNPRRGAEPEGAGEGFGSSEHGHFDDGGGSQPFM